MPWWWSFWMSSCVTCSGNMSWQYVNSMSWIMCVGEGVIGVCAWFGAPIMHRIFCLSLT